MKAIDVFQQLLRSDIFENESLIKSEISGKPLLLYISDNGQIEQFINLYKIPLVTLHTLLH